MPRPRGFNGAATSSSRIANISPSVRGVSLNASMGPRHHRRGSSTQTGESHGSIWRFNGAATSSSRIEFRVALDAVYLVASMGPRHHRRGSRMRGKSARCISSFNGAATSSSRIAHIQEAHVTLAHASMGPRHHRRGSVENHADVAGEPEASMGPRHHRRGSFGFGRASRNDRIGFNGAATSSSRIARDAGGGPDRGAMLQWGRDIIVADRDIS